VTGRPVGNRGVNVEGGADLIVKMRGFQSAGEFEKEKKEGRKRGRSKGNWGLHPGLFFLPDTVKKRKQAKRSTTKRRKERGI